MNGHILALDREYPHKVYLKNANEKTMAARNATSWLLERGHENGVEWEVVVISNQEYRSIFWFNSAELALEFKMVHT